MRNAKRCDHPQHEPPERTLPGFYWHVCPCCRLRTSFSIPAPSGSVAPRAALLAAAIVGLGVGLALLGSGCGRGPVCRPPTNPVADSGGSSPASKSECEVRR